MPVPAINARQLVQRTSSRIALPEMYWHARNALEDEDSSMRAIGQVIGHDPALTARLLRVANSAFFGLSRQVETVTRALTVLGAERVGELLLATSVVSAFDGLNSDAISAEAFWRQAVHTATAARLLALRCCVLDAERSFTQGLLHGIGHLVMYAGLPVQAHEATVLARRQGRAVAAVERELLGFDYAEVGAALAEHWKLPPATGAAIRWHLAPERAQTATFDVALTHLAYAIASGASGGRNCAFALNVTGLDLAALEDVGRAAERGTAEARALFAPTRLAA